MGSEVFLSKANTKFALALFKKFSEEDRTGNIFYSPFSISAALAMVRLGAAGNTATQMSEALCFSEPAGPPPEEDCPQMSETQRDAGPYAMLSARRQMVPQIQTRTLLPSYILKCLKPQDDKENVDASFGKLLVELSKPDALYVLSLANRLYGEKTYTFKDDYISETKKHYNAPLEPVDFNTNAEESRKNINSWVEEQTQDKIKELLASDAVDSSTKLVLVNAIYFKGTWAFQFEEADTMDDIFRLNKTDTKSVKMMKQKGKFNFSFIEETKCKVLELPYKGNELSMILILPHDIEDDTTGLEMLEKELTYDKFKELTGKDRLMNVDVKVSLPRFKMEESYDMKKVLISMGMVDAFDVSQSDFSGMSEANDLVLSKVVHKAYVEVNEEGTEAAASTAAVISERSAMIVETFNANHPFLLFIRHNPSDSVLFAGRFCSPE